jgi:hypothetical protein
LTYRHKDGILDQPKEEDADMDEDKIRQVILDTFEASLDAQLKAVKRLRGETEREKPVSKSMSQVDMVHDILKRVEGELHISEIIERVEKVHGLRLERESIVSALAKKIRKGDRFVRVGKNTYALRSGPASGKTE